MMVLRNVWPIVCLGAALVRPLGAQQTRASLVADGVQALQAGFPSSEALRLLAAGLAPAFGPPDSLWEVGVRTIAQIHVQDGRDSLAITWLRWAFRMHPDLPVPAGSLIEFAWRAARDSVRAAAAQDSLIRTTWIWSAQVGAPDQSGALRIRTLNVLRGARSLIRGVGVARPGDDVLTPGIYTIETSATGYATSHAAREVLPGVTTVLDITLVRTTVAQMPQPQPRTPPPSRQIRKSGGFPWPVAVLGVLAAGGVIVATRVGGGGGSGDTGGIIVTLPKQ